MAKKKSEDSDSPAVSPAAPYVVLARKYRPQTFDDLIGQEAMVKTLRNAFASGRIAQGYMLTGVRGVGKTTTARILARALNYETAAIHKPTIDMPVLGRHCAEIIESRHPDVIEMDAASNTGVDNVREIIESARYKPILARTKVFIIDEVHMLSKGAFNALLKTLEEPPEHVKFIFATTEIRKVPVTVLSRCQRFDLRRVDVPELSAHLGNITAKEGASAEPEALAMIARAAGGSVRDGLSILDQAIAMGSGKVSGDIVRGMLGLADRGRVFDLLETLLGGTPATALKGFGALHHDGAEPGQLLADLADVVHLVTRFKALGGDAGDEGVPAEDKRRAQSLAARLSMPLLARAWQMLLKGIEEAGKAPDPLAAAEMVLIRIAYVADLPPPDEILKALGGVGQVSRRAAGGGGAPAPAERDQRTPLNESPREQKPAQRAPSADTPPWADDVAAPDASPVQFELTDDPPPLEAYGDLIEGLGDEDDAPAAPVAPSLRPLRTFADVVELAGERRDARLRAHLEEYVSLVKFDGAAGSIDLFLLPGAPPEIANDLREKLNRWTERRWMVVLSKRPGEPTLGQQKREREAADLAMLKKHPAVSAIFDAFPDAKVAAVRTTAVRDEDEAGTG
ncbi:MAG: DNA polymerase III subunit gamma/tau [Hyphomicrobium sp.]|nr:DNA polymerase III subunit gamma/tau [Hyphomicrobium sp.]PPD08490.1 MAG: DNA polymerase III subunit gamma/tau [Hyphomicrobium sp.]